MMNYIADTIEPDTALLMQFAHQHPFYGGPAVYYARALLRINVEDVLPQLRKAKTETKPNKNDKPAQFVLSPNPATNSCTFRSNHELQAESVLIIENSLGNSVGKFVLTNGANSISFNTTALSNGIYTCKLIENKKISDIQRLVILK